MPEMLLKTSSADRVEDKTSTKTKRDPDNKQKYNKNRIATDNEIILKVFL